MKKLLMLCVLLSPIRPAFAEGSLEALCKNVDCLNNFTAKTGYDFSNGGQWTAGGFTDLKQSWYLSPGPGFNKPLFDSQAPAFFDINLIAKVGKFLADKVEPIGSFVRSSPFTEGLMKYTTFGYSASFDFTNAQDERWRHGPWGGFSVQF